MILNYLVEEFLTGDNYRTAYHKGWAEIYTDPTHREMRDIANADNNDEDSIRLATDSDGNVYAWIYSILHDEMERILGKKWALRFEYNYPHKDLWLGGGTSPETWEKYGSEDLIVQLGRSIPGLKEIKFVDSGDIAWEK